MVQRSSPSPVLTAREVSSREGLLDCVTAIQSARYRLGNHSEFFRALLQRFGSSINGDKPIGRAVIRLFFRSSPTHVSYLIRQVVVNSVNSVLGTRLWAQVLIKLLKLIERRNNDSAFIPVRSNFYGVRGVDASGHHAMPTIPFRGFCHPVLGDSGTLPQASALPTGRNKITSNLTFPRSRFVSTVTEASIDPPLFGVSFKQFFYGQLFMAIASFKHQFIVLDAEAFVQGEMA